MDQYNYMTFKSVSYAMKVEAVLKENAVDYKVIPVPRTISSGCGLCIRFLKKDSEKIQGIIRENNLSYEKIYLEA